MQVKCPRCKHLFEADGKRDLTCPECRFRAPAPAATGSEGLALACPRCGATVEARPGERVACPDCGFSDQTPGQATDRLRLACPRCAAEVEGALGERVECQSCGYVADVTEEAPNDDAPVPEAPTAAGDASRKAKADAPGRVQVACPRCDAELVGTPGETLACACGFAAEVPSPSNQGQG